MDEIIDIIYHSMPATCKNKMIEQGFNYVDCNVKEMTNFFEIRLENLELREDKKKYPASFMKNRK